MWGFTSVGFAMGIFALLSFVALIRYRAMVPLMYLTLLLENLGRLVLSAIYPVAKTGSGFSAEINLAIVTALVLGLIMSLQSR